MSSGPPTLPNAVCDPKKAFLSGLLRIAALLKSVSIGPGATTFAVCLLIQKTKEKYADYGLFKIYHTRIIMGRDFF